MQVRSSSDGELQSSLKSTCCRVTEVEKATIPQKSAQNSIDQPVPSELAENLSNDELTSSVHIISQEEVNPSSCLESTEIIENGNRTTGLLKKVLSMFMLTSSST